MTVATHPSAVRQTEFTLARAVVLFRGAGLLEFWIVTMHNASVYRGRADVVTALLAAVTAESVVLGLACLRARRVRPWWAAADLIFTVAVLVVSAMVSLHYRGLYVAFPYSVICSVAFGIGFRRLSAVVAATVILAAGYLYGGGYLHADPAPNVMVNAVTYFPNTLVAWAVSWQLRRMGRDLEVSRSREAVLARDTERLRQARLLHDRVLQTMETLARGQWTADSALKARVAEEAIWLRSLVEGTGEGSGRDLLGQLNELIARAARDGLHVEFNHATLREPAVLAGLDARCGAALVGAVSEALNNVVKHAATTSAVLRLAAGPGTLVVTVLDQGRGFDPAAQPAGMGIRESIRGRVTESGGTVRIDTAPGAGTLLEISMPLTSGPSSAGLVDVEADA
ncbi:MAG TPA: ATP-binding protein [Streptosporangiaceae bacterium]|nr:ATP-binding protein [Streptosporangiaceae bacterium]